MIFLYAFGAEIIFREKGAIMNTKIIYALLMYFPLATTCMDNGKPSLLQAIKNRIRQIPGAVARANAGLKLYKSRSPEIMEAYLEKLEQKKTPDEYGRLYAEWATMLLERNNAEWAVSDNNNENEHDAPNFFLLISRGADLCHFTETFGTPLLTVAVRFNNAVAIKAILAQIKKYPDEELARAEQRIHTLLCCFNRNKIALCRDVRNLLINASIAALLEPQPERIAQLATILAQEEPGGYRAYDYAQDKAKEISYDPELLNPEAARTQFQQEYLDTCARFRKTIFK
jgi:hypothetical protein